MQPFDGPGRGSAPVAGFGGGGFVQRLSGESKVATVDPPGVVGEWLAEEWRDFVGLSCSTLLGFL